MNRTTSAASATPRDVHHRDRGGRTPLHYAAGDKKPDDVQALIAAGAEIDAREDTGQYTPLMFAAQFDSNIDVIKALVEAGADINLTNSKGETPLWIATKSPSYNGNAGAEIIRYLLDHGADPYIEVHDDTTVIDYVKTVNDKPGRRAAFGSLLDGDARHTPPDLSPSGTAGSDLPDAVPHQVQDTSAPITVTATTWQEQFNELWARLVPSGGGAATVQGEVIRLAGRIAHELLDNGGINWNRDYTQMKRDLLKYLASETPVTTADELSGLSKRINRDTVDDEALARINELAVNWVLANPDPLTWDALRGRKRRRPE